MVYPFETAAYETNIGEVSMPVRTNFGYHIVKVFDKREARGTITTAHIMVVTNDNPSRSDEENAKKKINEIYEKLKNGESFDKLARLYSDDPGSKSKGGELPAFGSGTNQRMVTEFEDAAFALDENGDFSKPFKTAYGYHIVKRLDYQPLGTKEELLPSIKQKINRGNRAEATQEAFINSLKTENKFVDKKNKRIEWFYENIDSTVFKKNWKAPSLPKNKWMFKYHKQKYDMQSFLDHIENQKRRNPMPIKTFIDKNYKDWQNDIILSDEKSRLEEKYPAYKALLQEYHDGVLLYEIMKDKVWDKAINDTTGLEKFFNKNIDQYQWEERLKVNIYSSDKREMVLEAALLTDIDSMNMSSILNKVNADSQLNLEAKQGKFVQEDHPVLAGKDLKLGKNEIFKHNEKFYLVVVEETLPAGPKELSEAKGRVIQDYQEYLEKKWLEELNNKHTIKVNKDVLYQLGE
ncbi:hypothetical protein CW751_06225 [Brumimicrobium salinarum]|uniref:PpiC domain-containing protein n=1 Tax=Brumimicrobium salinarum TaxID=2058658 RepID=A0A2I0R3M3_9FLAO|nr:peptidylprolyl isomerase [Brumimicrobium salinarum]PKR81178.1 hypothetical protein CW751_06225 [Brumimicrobium salinarum]